MLLLHCSFSIIRYTHKKKVICEREELITIISKLKDQKKKISSIEKITKNHFQIIHFQ